jgi:hypothetical protein
MSAPTESSEFKNHVPLAPITSTVAKVIEGRKTKSGKAPTVKVAFYLPIDIERSLRFASIRLEMAEESVYTLQHMFQDAMKRYVDWLTKAKKIDFSPVQLSPATESATKAV